MPLSRNSSISRSPVVRPTFLSPPVPDLVQDIPEDAKTWVEAWRKVTAKDLLDSQIVAVDAERTVEEACDLLLSESVPCLAVKADQGGDCIGLFDFSDVNAFLTLAATRHTPQYDGQKQSRADQIVWAARSGRVPVRLVSDLSEKNPLEILPSDASLLALLSRFSQGAHRVLISDPSTPSTYLGFVSDRRLLSYFHTFASDSDAFSSFQSLLSHPLQDLKLPSLFIYSSVIAAPASATVLDAMRLMSEEGVSSVAVVEDTGRLLSAVSVTDIGKIIVPSDSNQILSTPLHQLISQIKEPDGSTDGVDRYPVYTALPTSTLDYSIKKLLATNAHRLFITHEDPTTTPTPGKTNLSGIISIVDILALFARIANIPNVDPQRMQRHRRASTSSTSSSRSSSSSRPPRNRNSFVGSPSTTSPWN